MRAPIIAALLALTACATPETATRDGRPVVTLSGAVLAPMRETVTYSPGRALFRLPRNGGHLHEAQAIAQLGNIRGDCFAIGDGVLQSAGVIIARQANCFARPDPDARVFGIHMSHIGGVVNDAGTHEYFGPQGIAAPGCLDWYLRQPEAAGNRIAFVSWSMLERNCR